MENNVLQEQDVQTIVKLFLKDPELVQNKRKFYDSILKLPPGEFFDIERRSYLSGAESYEFFSTCLWKWISYQGTQAKFIHLISNLKNENFCSVADKMFHYSQQGSTYENNGSYIWFDVPEVIQNFTGRKADLETLHESIIKDKNNNVTVITTVSGLGGVGKTSLAAKYAWEYHNFFGNVIWINAESTVSLKDSFLRLGQYLDINITESKENKLKDTVTEVYKYLNNKMCLFIFDNAEKDDGVINEFLPLKSTPYITKPFVLLTSRNKIWNDRFRLIILNVFNATESIEFLQSYLDLEDGSDIELGEKLSHILQHLPIAIRQASAYIKCQKDISNKSNSDCIQDYLKEFENNKKSLLKFEYWKKTGDPFRQTTYVTWNVTLQKIKLNPLSLRIMKIISILNPDNIPIDIFEHFRSYSLWKKTKSLFVPRHSSVLTAIELLTQYSMITKNQDRLNVHRLVQTVIREQLTDFAFSNKLLQCMRLLETCLNIQKSDSHKKLLLLHSESVISYSITKKLTTKSQNFKEFVLQHQDMYVKLQIEKGDELFQQKKYLDAIETYTDARDSMKTIGMNERTDLVIAMKLGQTFKMHGDYENALKCYDYVINSNFRGMVYFDPADLDFNEKTFLELLQSRHEVLQNLGKENEAPKIFTDLFENNINKDETNLVLKTLTVIIFLGIRNINSEYNLPKVIFENQVSDSWITLLTKSSVIQIGSDNNICIHLTILYWITMYSQTTIAKIALNRCFQILNTKASTNSLLSVWRNALEYEDIVNEFWKYGIVVFESMSILDSDELQLLIKTLILFSRNFEFRYEDIFNIIFNKFNFIKNKGEVNNLELVHKLSQILFDILAIESINCQLKLLPLFKLYLYDVIMCIIDIIIEIRIEDMELKKDLCEDAIQFCKIMSQFASINNNETCFENIVTYDSNVLILIPILLFGRDSEAFEIISEFLLKESIVVNNSNLLLQIIYCMLLGGSNSFEFDINTKIIEYALCLSLKGFNECNKYPKHMNQSLTSYKGFKISTDAQQRFAVFMKFCHVFLTSRNIFIKSEKLILTILNESLKNSIFFSYLKILLVKIKSPGYKTTVQNCLLLVKQEYVNQEDFTVG